MGSSLDKLEASVKAKSTIRVDSEKVAYVVSRLVNDHVDRAIAVPVEGLRQELASYRSDVSSLGEEKVSAVKEAAAEMVAELKAAREEIESIERRVTFVGISRLSLAVLPLFAALAIVGGLVWGLGSMVGVGPLFGWAWASFRAASVWWAKALIAVGTLGAAAAFVWIVLRLSQWIYDELR